MFVLLFFRSHSLSLSSHYMETGKKPEEFEARIEDEKDGQSRMWGKRIGKAGKLKGAADVRACAAALVPRSRQ